MTDIVKVIYGEGDPKKHSLKMEALSSEPSNLPVGRIGDIYIPRSVLDELGAKDSDRIEVTYRIVR